MKRPETWKSAASCSARCPIEQARARDEYYSKQASDQMNSVDNHFMRNNDPRMPLFSDRKSSSSRGNGFGSGSK